MLKLKRYRVIGFRSVKDSGWIETTDVGALIGVNESGKTNLLVPLYKLNPVSSDGAIVPLSDYPRGEYSDLRASNHDAIFVRATFEVNDALAEALAKLTSSTQDNFAEVDVARRFDGQYVVTFPKASAPTISSSIVSDLLANIDGELDSFAEEKVLAGAVRASIEQAQETLAGANADSLATLKKVEASLAQVHLGDSDSLTPLAERWTHLLTEVEQMMQTAKGPHPDQNPKATELALKHLPKFVYYSNYGNLDSEIYLPHVIENMSRGSLGTKETAKARTLKVLFDFVRLKPEEILALGKSARDANPKPAPTQDEIDEAAKRTKERSVLLQSAGTKLTKEFREWWKQGTYRFRFEADGDHFRIWVSDDLRPEEIELESRSTGLQWFLSFFLVFLVESGDAHKNAILLLDEPGLSLHPLSQRDLSSFFDNLAKTNQLLYTTHSPFLVDPDRLDRVHAVYVDEGGATAVSSDLRAGKVNSAEARSVYAVHAALGLSVSDALLQGCTNVIVEGPSDQLYMTGIKSILIGAGKIKPSRELLFPPAGGAKGVMAMVPIITGKDEEPPRVVLDSDGPGQEIAKKLRSGPIYSGEHGKRITNVGELLDGLKGAEVEDLLPHTLIVDVVSRVYRGESDFRDVAKEGSAIVPQIEAYAAQNQIALEAPGWKVELARAVKQRMLKAPSEIPPDSIKLWTKLFASF